MTTITIFLITIASAVLLLIRHQLKLNETARKTKQWLKEQGIDTSKPIFRQVIFVYEDPIEQYELSIYESDDGYYLQKDRLCHEPTISDFTHVGNDEKQLFDLIRKHIGSEHSMHVTDPHRHLRYLLDRCQSEKSLSSNRLQNTHKVRYRDDYSK